MIRRIAVLAGDDLAPGVNSVVRAITRTAHCLGWEVIGVSDGYSGLIDGEFISLTVRTIDEAFQVRNSILGSSDGRPFLTEAAQRCALKQLGARDIHALIVVGGDVAQLGALALSKLDFPVNGIAASVENDIPSFDMALGVDTAMNVSIESVNQLRLMHPETGCTFLVEVAGRRCGSLALMSGLACGADVILIPEVDTPLEQILEAIKAAYESQKPYPKIVMSEGAAYTAESLRHAIETCGPPGRKVQLLRLGFIQRRSAPNAYDRLLGARLGASTVDALARGEFSVLVGSSGGEIRTIPLSTVSTIVSAPDMKLLHLANRLSNSKFAVAQA